MTQFLEPMENVDGLPIKDNRSDYRSYLCPKCKGHGGWNLRLNSYGEGKHFQQTCGQCNGWGWVSEKDKDCVHEYRELSALECRLQKIQHYGMHDHVYQCKSCGRIVSYDSSG